MRGGTWLVKPTGLSDLSPKGDGGGIDKSGDSTSDELADKGPSEAFKDSTTSSSVSSGGPRALDSTLSRSTRSPGLLPDHEPSQKALHSPSFPTAGAHFLTVSQDRTHSPSARRDRQEPTEKMEFVWF